jgi:hypothetical protein
MKNEDNLKNMKSENGLKKKEEKKSENDPEKK